MRYFVYKEEERTYRLRYCSDLKEFTQAEKEGYTRIKYIEAVELAREANYELRHYGRDIGDTLIFPWNFTGDIDVYNSSSVEIDPQRIVTIHS